MSQRIRGQEATITVLIDGDMKLGSFAKVMSLNLTPRTDLAETPFIGELEDDLDIQHHGFDFDFEIHNQDSSAYDLLAAIVSREQDRLPHPAINIVVTLAFRSLTEPSVTFVMENCFLKMDSLGIGGRKDYITSKFSGKCKTLATL
jgi:hypothetical protein